MDGRARWKTMAVVVGLAVLVLVCWGGLVAIDRAQTHNRRVIERIRNGEAIEASSIEFTGRRFPQLTDPASVSCFMAALRSARPYRSGQDDFGGVTYAVNIHLADGGMFTVVVHVPEHDRGMSLYTDLEYLGINDPDYYYITFPDPIPEAFAQFLKRLRKPNG